MANCRCCGGREAGEEEEEKMSVIRGDGVIVYLCMVMRGMIMFWCNNCMKISPI